MKLIACVRLSNWSIDRRRRRGGGRKDDAATRRHGDAALVLIRTIASRQVVVCGCRRAWESGVRGGMSLAEACALCPGLSHADHDPAGDARALEALGRWMMMRFSPVVQPVWENGVPGLFIEVGGLERLHGSLEVVIEKMAAALARFGLGARIAVAPTPGAAWAMTFLKDDRLIATGHLKQVLSPAPIEGLRLEDEVIAKLHHLGIRTIAQVMALPRRTLPSRFGHGLLLRIDQAMGEAAEPLAPLLYQPPIEAGIDFDGVVESLEVLHETVRGLLEQVIAQLQRRGAGVRKMNVKFLRPYAPAVEKMIDLSRPTRRMGVLFNLVRCGMETLGKVRKKKFKVEGGFRGQGSGFSEKRVEKYQPVGFIGVFVRVLLYERIDDEQIGLREEEEWEGREEVDRLIERVRIRLGEKALVGVEGVESYVPERGFRVRGSACDEFSRVGFRGEEQSEIPNPKSQISQKSAIRNPQSAIPQDYHQPFHLFGRPQEIGVMVRPSHDRDGAPVSFTLDGQVRRIRHVVGPERISGAWWTGHEKTRDYFDVEDEEGRRWWVFRVMETFRWFLHGVFE